MRGLRFAAAALTAAVLGAGTADAAIITVTVNGTLTSGFDQSGMFGAANTDLAGAAFTYLQTYDTNLGNLQLGTPTEAVQGGWLNGLPSTGDATITVNGASVTLTELGYSQYLAGNSGYASSWAKEVIIVDHLTTENDVFAQIKLDGPLRLGTSFHGVCDADSPCSGSFELSQYHFVTQPGNPYPGGYLYNNSGQFDIDTYDVAVSVPIPEPATWAMMILGFGLAGATLRRRRVLAA